MLICAPITATTTEGAIQDMNTALAEADIVELRVDYLAEIHLQELLKRTKDRILVTNRKKSEGGHFQGTEIERVEVLNKAVCLGAGYVDIEESTKTELIDELRMNIHQRHHKTKLIISYHNFCKTPLERNLKKIFEACCQTGADIIKIVTLANAIEDNLRILNLIQYAHKQEKEIIAFCMGNLGRISRLAAPVFGSYLSYASLGKEKESAPGQLSTAAMKTFFGLMEMKTLDSPSEH